MGEERVASVNRRRLVSISPVRLFVRVAKLNRMKSEVNFDTLIKYSTRLVEYFGARGVVA